MADKEEAPKKGWGALGEKGKEEDRPRKLYTKEDAASIFNKAREQGEVKSQICAVVYGFQGTGN